MFSFTVPELFTTLNKCQELNPEPNEDLIESGLPYYLFLLKRDSSDDDGMVEDEEEDEECNGGDGHDNNGCEEMEENK
jgi:hypothetical protein